GKSRFWRKLFADIYNKKIIETNIGQDAGSLGAAGLAAVGAGVWKDFSIVKKIHEISDYINPDLKEVEAYAKIIPLFEKIADIQSEIGDMMAQLN
ncbi:MAG: pentose kinase, partial [Clostridia bacterium]|nr:pentose kinase [Clostridia bacterium]